MEPMDISQPLFPAPQCLFSGIMKMVDIIAMHGLYSIDFLSPELVWLLMDVQQQRPTQDSICRMGRGGGVELDTF